MGIITEKFHAVYWKELNLNLEMKTDQNHLTVKSGPSSARVDRCWWMMVKVLKVSHMFFRPTLRLKLPPSFPRVLVLSQEVTGCQWALSKPKGTRVGGKSLLITYTREASHISRGLCRRLGLKSRAPRTLDWHHHSGLTLATCQIRGGIPHHLKTQ